MSPPRPSNPLHSLLVFANLLLSAAACCCLLLTPCAAWVTGLIYTLNLIISFQVRRANFLACVMAQVMLAVSDWLLFVYSWFHRALKLN